MSDRIVHRTITYNMHRRGENTESCIKLPMTQSLAEQLDDCDTQYCPPSIYNILQHVAMLQDYAFAKYVSCEKTEGET